MFKKHGKYSKLQSEKQPLDGSDDKQIYAYQANSRPIAYQKKKKKQEIEVKTNLLSQYWHNICKTGSVTYMSCGKNLVKI